MVALGWVLVVWSIAHLAGFTFRHLAGLLSRNRADVGSVKAWHLVLAMLLLFPLLLGMKSGFNRSPDWSKWSILASALIAAVPAMLLARLSMTHGFKSKSVRHLGFFNLLMVFFLIEGFTTLFLYFIVANTLPDWYTQRAGTLFDERGVPFTLRDYGYRECDHQVRGPFFARGNTRGHYCAGSGEYAALRHSTRARVRGLETWFGRRIALVTPESEQVSDR